MLGAVADVRGAVGRVVETVGLAPGGHGGVASPGARGHAALLGRPLTLYYIIIIHSLSECGFEILKTYQAPAHIWDLPR